ncbi:protein scribble homolog isoform X2 [Pollicipes pollicipes]|uniref:protein scribble homolog isoform X2 n=1 Tax=Pollicipes pollicipes TaxID=41117 RepID=UPI001884D75A|nr:protein scribble homolog isoform X2 [Pollicipes pollicipes]
MADSLENESVQALLTIKNGGYFMKGEADSTLVTTQIEAMTDENSGNKSQGQYISQHSSEGNPGFLSALGLHPAGENVIKRTPEKTVPPIFNRRGTPQRIRKKNRLYFDDDHVSAPTFRSSPKKSPAPARERTLVPAPIAAPPRPAATTPKKALSRPAPSESAPAPAPAPAAPSTPSKPPIGPKPRVAPRRGTAPSEAPVTAVVATPEAQRLEPGPAPAADTPSPQPMTFSAMKRFFETEVRSQKEPTPKAEEKFGTMTAEEFESHLEGHLVVPDSAENSVHVLAEELGASEHDSHPAQAPATADRPRMMTAKAERRLRESAGNAASADEQQMSPAEWRALQAEKRAAWRQARLKSLEQDALQAQIVIRKMSELTETPEVEPPAAVDGDNNPVSAPADNNANSTGTDSDDSGEERSPSPASGVEPNENKTKRRRRKR